MATLSAIKVCIHKTLNYKLVACVCALSLRCATENMKWSTRHCGNGDDKFEAVRQRENDKIRSFFFNHFSSSFDKCICTSRANVKFANSKRQLHVWRFRCGAEHFRQMQKLNETSDDNDNAHNRRTEFVRLSCRLAVAFVRPQNVSHNSIIMNENMH